MLRKARSVVALSCLKKWMVGGFSENHKCWTKKEKGTESKFEYLNIRHVMGGNWATQRVCALKRSLVTTVRNAEYS